jgi:hypothetical protein
MVSDVDLSDWLGLIEGNHIEQRPYYYRYESEDWRVKTLGPTVAYYLKDGAALKAFNDGRLPSLDWRE